MFKFNPQQRKTRKRRKWPLLTCVNYMVFAILVGCGRNEKGTPSLQFEKFVGSHQHLSHPPQYSFKSVYMQKPAPNNHTVTWGKIDGYFRFFNVTNLKNQPNIFPKSIRVDYETLAKSLESYVDVEKEDWIAVGNSTYGFSVRPNNAEKNHTLLGFHETPIEVVTPSSIPFASLYDNCFYKNIELFYTIEEVTQANSDIFPNSIAVKMKHKTKNYSKILYFDTEEGVSTGEQSIESSSVSSQMIFRYDKTGERWRFLASEVYFPDSQGELELTRVHYFLEWKLDDSLDTKTCFLSHYGLPEPPSNSKPNRIWIYLSIGSGALLVVIAFIVLKRKQFNS